MFTVKLLFKYQATHSSLCRTCALSSVDLYIKNKLGQFRLRGNHVVSRLIAFTRLEKLGTGKLDCIYTSIKNSFAEKQNPCVSEKLPSK